MENKFILKKNPVSSVTRFGEIWPLWQHFKSLAFVCGYNLALGIFFNLLLKIAYAIR